MIVFNNIYKQYNSEEILSNLNLKIQKNKTTLLMGISGSGKTTLANLLMGLIKPDRGYIEGIKDIKISAVFQEDRLVGKLSPIANVRLVVSSDISNDEIIEDFLKVNLEEDLLHKAVSKLSGGQSRRVSIVRAMMKEADLYCLDEPFKGLDEVTKLKTIDYVKNRTKDKTLLIISHDIELKKYFDAECINLDLHQ